MSFSPRAMEGRPGTLIRAEARLDLQASGNSLDIAWRVDCGGVGENAAKCTSELTVA